MDKRLKNWVINVLRRASFKWKARGEAEKKFRVPNGKFKTGRIKYGYKCNKCKQIFKKKDTVTDHTDPVIPMEGFSSFDDYIPRLFCEEHNFQVLCGPCHDVKTTKEKEFRARYRKIEEEDEGVLREEWKNFLDSFE